LSLKVVEARYAMIAALTVPDPPRAVTAATAASVCLPAKAA